MLLAVLFIGTGLLTYQIYYWVAKAADQYQVVLQFLPGLPFGVACSLRFVRPGKRIPLAILLDCVTWFIAFRLGLLSAGDNVNPYAVTAAAGMVGALGVTTSTGLGCSSLHSHRTLIGAAALGAITGAPFGLVVNRSPQENLILAISFPLWQVAVGLWIGMNAK
jgi:hypothetical protein